MTAMATVEVPKQGFQSCDRCGARSKVLAVLTNGGQLLFCQHHFNQHEAALVKQGAVIAIREDKE